MKGSIGNFRPWHILLKNPTTCTRSVGITFQTKKCNILAYYHKLLTKLLNFCVVKNSKNKIQFRKKQICGNTQLSCLKISRLITYNIAWGEPMNNSRAFISLYWQSLRHVLNFCCLDTCALQKTFFFFFQTRLCNKAENYSLFKVKSYEFMSSNVLIHFTFF